MSPSGTRRGVELAPSLSRVISTTRVITIARQRAAKPYQPMRLRQKSPARSVKNVSTASVERPVLVTEFIEARLPMPVP